MPLNDANATDNLDQSKIVIKDSNDNGPVDIDTLDSVERLETKAVITGKDNLNNYRQVQTIVRSDGLVAIPTDSRTVVESTFGYDPLPDAHFRIINTGATGNTWTITIAATSVDPTSPDRDVPQYQKVFTVLVGEVGSEIALRDRIIQELNQDTTFRDTCHLKAFKATDRAIVQISSSAFSLNGEFYERPLSGDFTVVVTGTANASVPTDNLISRSKPISISRDPDSPHNLGVFGISGSVFVTAKALEDLYIEEATNVTHGADMLQNGSLVSPIDFMVDACDCTDIFIEHLIFNLQGSGIKFGQFGAKNTALTNGIEVQIKSDNVTTTLPLLKTTEDFKNKFAALSGDGANFRLDNQAGADEFLAILRFNNPFILRVEGTFAVDDYIRIRIQDDISAGNAIFNFRVKGFEKEP